MVRALLETEPDRRFSDRAEQRHRLWALRGDRLETVTRALAGSRPLIADGHHRYAAYLQLQQARPGTAWDRGLAMLVDQDDTPLFLGAIHRVLRGVPLADLGDVVARGPHTLATCSQAAALDALDRTPWPSPTDGRGPRCASRSPATAARSRSSTTRSCRS